KVIVYAEESGLRDALLESGGQLVEDYGAFALMNAPQAAAEQVRAQSRAGSGIRDDMNMVLLKARQFDTTTDRLMSSSSIGPLEKADRQLYLVQMIGPIKKKWRNAVEANSEVIGYIPNNTLLVRASATGIEQISRLAAEDNSFVQWTGLYFPEYKIAPEISMRSDEDILATIEIAVSDPNDAEVDRALTIGDATPIGGRASVGGISDVRVSIRTSRLPDLARLSNVLWVEPWTPPQLLDEKQDQILAGNYSGSTVSIAGYVNWLQSKGLATTPDFVVDVADSGIDQGDLDPQVIHKDFLNAAEVNRVVYARFVGQLNVPQASAEDISGHGTLNASIVGGFNTKTGFPFVDGDNFHYGLGAHPFVKLGASRIFAPQFTNPDLQELVSNAYRDGARITSNSWGAYNNSYNSDCRIYDALVRDAQPAIDGLQPINIIFSSGNKGAGGHLSVPGNAKNVIDVGATEGLRPGTDGCAIDSTGADNVNQLAVFSSGGPTDDGRKKPDIVAPGTHIQGVQSQSTSFDASGVCGPMNTPAGQTLYTWSSGTSHSAPAVAGAAALVRQYFQQSTGHPPSPAMTKALLLNSTTYVSGSGGGDSLPGDQQGWGLLNVGKTLDGTPRMLIDQDRTLSDAGGSVTIQGSVSDPSKPFRVTLGWTDAPGNPPALGPAINDLDLRVQIGGKTYLGNNFGGEFSVENGSADHLNNVESVWLPAGGTGNFTITVVAGNIAADGVPLNSDSTDQDFALVVYNASSSTGGGGGGGGPVDNPPSVTLRFPAGGETIMVGSTAHITWDAADDKGIQTQVVEFAADGFTFNTIAELGGSARSFEWHVPALLSHLARIKVTVLDGVNLPVSSTNAIPFTVEQGPPDLIPPSVTLLEPNSDSIVGGGNTMIIKWRETDNVGGIERRIERSTDSGEAWQLILTLHAPSSGQQQVYNWQVPGELSTQRGKLRLTVFDGAGNSASAISTGKFEVWAMPVITRVQYDFGVS